MAALGQMESEIVITGLVPQVEFTRLASLHSADLWQARRSDVIHVLFAARKTWMRGTEPAHDGYNEREPL